MPQITREDILTTLATVEGISGGTVVSEDRVSGITIQGNSVGFILTAPADLAPTLQAKCERALSSFPGIDKVTIVATAHNDAPSFENHPLSLATASARSGGVNAKREGAEPPVSEANQKRPANWSREPIPNVKRIIAIASGKGGVGKSSVTVLLAHALTKLGQNVAICDADIYGPSIPRMLGLPLDQPRFANNLMQPFRAHGIGANSLAFITGDSAAIMRGPMVSKSLQQLLRGTEWANDSKPLDYLLLDLPPGTGDVQLSLVQSLKLDGALLLTTPQEIAVMDARKAGAMFRKTDTRLLGVIENMSGFTDPSGQLHHLFGTGGGESLAEAFNLKLLAQLPLDPTIGQALERGDIPPQSPVTDAMARIADFLIKS